MGKKKHKRGLKKGQFCAVPGRPCDCGKDYVEICKPAWANFTFPRIVRSWDEAKKHVTKRSLKKKSYEAHHVLCVSSVSKQIVAKPGIDAIIRQTKWCINEKENMMGMPLWGHTVRWYCSIVTGLMRTAIAPPPFNNIPQHDWDHNSKLGYTHEVTQELKGLAKDIEEADHEVDSEDIKGELDRLSRSFKARLRGRGSSRNGGTHAGWLMGLNDVSAAWYLPFSMASTANLTKKGFPVKKFDEKTAAWIQKMADALSGIAR